MVDKIDENEIVKASVMGMEISGKVLESISEDSYMVEITGMSGDSEEIKVGDVILLDGSEMVR